MQHYGQYILLEPLPNHCQQHRNQWELVGLPTKKYQYEKNNHPDIDTILTSPHECTRFRWNSHNVCQLVDCEFLHCCLCCWITLHTALDCQQQRPNPPPQKQLSGDKVSSPLWETLTECHSDRTHNIITSEMIPTVTTLDPYSFIPWDTNFVTNSFIFESLHSIKTYERFLCLPIHTRFITIRQSHREFPWSTTWPCTKVRTPLITDQ